MPEYFPRAVIKDDAPLLHDDAPARVAGDQLHVVSDHDNRVALRVQDVGQFHEQGPALQVLSRGRFIEDDNLRVHRQDGGKGDALPIAPAERERVPLGHLMNPDGVHRFAGPPLQRLALQTEAYGAYLDFLDHAGPEELMIWVLQYQADAASQPRGRELLRRLAKHGQVARRWFQQANEVFDKRGLACAILANQPYELTSVDAQRDAPERLVVT